MARQQEQDTNMGEHPRTDQPPDLHTQEHAPPRPLVRAVSWPIARGAQSQAGWIAESSQQVPEAISGNRSSQRLSDVPLLDNPVSNSTLCAFLNNKVKLPLTDQPSQEHAPPIPLGRSLDSLMEFYSTFRHGGSLQNSSEPELNLEPETPFINFESVRNRRGGLPANRSENESEVGETLNLDAGTSEPGNI